MVNKSLGRCAAWYPARRGARRAMAPAAAFKLLAGCFLALAVFACLPACDVDLMGLFASSEPDERFESRNTFNFLTPAERSLSLPEEYSFIVISDTHIQDGDAHGLEKIKAAVIPGDKFVVITGDITQDGKQKNIEKFIEIATSLRDIGVPCYPVVGNHDVYFNNWKVWRDKIGSTVYRVGDDASSTTLFVLDSANASLGKDQFDWLRRELGSANPRVFVFTHANFFTETIGDLEQFTDYRERARIISLLEGRSDAVFAGHVHRRIIRKAGGVQYITLEDYVRHRVYCRVYVKPSGISWEFKKL